MLDVNVERVSCVYQHRFCLGMYGCDTAPVFDTMGGLILSLMLQLALFKMHIAALIKNKDKGLCYLETQCGSKTVNLVMVEMILTT